MATDPTKKPQVKLILDYLLAGNKITWIEAFNLFGSNNLKGRIWDLKELGWNIRNKFITLPNKKRVKEYWIDEIDRVPILGDV